MNPGSAYITRGINTIKSIVTEVNLADLRKTYEIPSNVTLRVPSARDLPSLPHEGEIAITIPAFFCGLRVPFPAFLRRFFHLAPLHPIQLSPSGWQVLLGAYIQWRRLHNADPTMEELRATFSLRTSGVAGHYYGYRFTPLCWRVWPAPRIGRRGGSSWVEHGKERDPAPPGATEFLQTSMSSTGPRHDLPIPQVSLLGLTSCWT